MKREIKFRGKRIDNGEWGYGSYYYDGVDGTHFVDNWRNTKPDPNDGSIDLIHEWHQVHPETVGQYTGLNDKDGNEIYEGDFVSTDLERPYTKIIFKNGAFMFECYDGNLYHDIFFPTSDLPKIKYEYGKVIGNIHDNPELI